MSDTTKVKERPASVLTDDDFDALTSSPSVALSTVVDADQPSQGRIVRREVPHLEAWARDDTYKDISAKPVTNDQAKTLCDPLTDDEVDIKPDSFGAVYLSHSGYRRRLNAAFKPAGWALRRLTPYTFDQQQKIAYAEFGLYAEGRFVGMATGEMRLADNNDEMSKGDIIEGLKSNALMRACKDLGMAMECWDLKWTQSFRARLCVRVWVRKHQSAQPKLQWRRLDAAPFYGETGCANDSPNKEKYQQGRTEGTQQAHANALDGIDDELRGRIERGFDVLRITNGMKTVKITEFLGKVTDPSERAQAAVRLYEWLKGEYTRQKHAPASVQKPDNGKAASSVGGSPAPPAVSSGTAVGGAAPVAPLTVEDIPFSGSKPLPEKGDLF